MAAVERRAAGDTGDGGSRRDPSVFGRRARVVAFVAIVLVAALLRLPALETRPMHADEAVHAAKFGRLLEQGLYEYDPNEYHGPTLYYLTLVPARATGVARYADLDERILRLVPAVLGVLLVAAHVLLVPVLGFPAAALAALLAAVSPAMVYYSRDYIQETLLAAFGFGALIALGRYLAGRRLSWAIAGGAALGLMVATKETWVIAAGSMAAAAAVVEFRQRWRTGAPGAGDARRTVGHLAAAVAVALGISMLFYSSFFRHPRGLVDAVAAYTTYVSRAGGTASWHVHPWHYYFGLLGFSKSAGTPAWTEGAIAVLASIGLASVVRRRERDAVPGRPAFDVVLAVYAVAMTVAYSAIPYKTPWCVLGFLHGWILLAGVGAWRLVESARGRTARALVACALVVALSHLAWQAWQGSYRFAADPRNPYVYAHTGPGIFDIARRVEALSAAHESGAAMPIEVITSRNLWPLPWYLRRFSAVRWETMPVNDGVQAPVVLATPEMEDAVRQKLYEWRRPGERELYVSMFDRVVELRPEVEVRGYAAKSLWDRFENR